MNVFKSRELPDGSTIGIFPYYGGGVLHVFRLWPLETRDGVEGQPCREIYDLFSTDTPAEMVDALFSYHWKALSLMTVEGADKYFGDYQSTFQKESA